MPCHGDLRCRSSLGYGVLLTLHLLAAVAFAGTVFFEVMPWAPLVLFAAGVSLAWHHRALLEHPLASTGLLMTLKMALALSVFAHFASAMMWRKKA